MKKILTLSISAILFGCNDNSTPEQLPEVNIYKATNIYATSAGNYGRAFMLSSAFSENAERSILAMGVTDSNYPVSYKSNIDTDFEISPLINDFEEISLLVTDANNLDGDKDTNLYLGVIPVTSGNMLSKEAFGSLQSIYLVPEGTSLLTYPDWRIDNIITFAKKAKLQGVSSVKLILWDSIDKQLLLDSNLQIARLEEAGIDYEFVNFNKMSKEIKANSMEDELLTAAIHSGAIGESVLSEPIFSKNVEFEDNLKNIVLFGSYTKDDADVSYTNQIEILKKLEITYNPNEYNIIFKGHPREVSVNNWIENNSQRISYFKSFPYELWQVLGKGEFNYNYNDEKYSIYLPEQPSKIYSIFSTTLYGEDASKIELILGYNSIDDSNNLIDDVHPITSSDLTEYNRWKALTGDISTQFKMTYDWLGE